MTGRFEKPSIEEISAYGREIGFRGFDAGRFFDHYEMIGWVVGKARTPMQSWRPAVRVWQRNQAAWAGAAAAPVERDPVILQYAAQGKRIIAGGGFEIGRFWSKVRDAIGPDGLARVKALARGQTGA